MNQLLKNKGKLGHGITIVEIGPPSISAVV
jgi:hypothetical protein